MKKILLAIAILTSCIAAYAQGENCFGIIAGKKATTDGSVLFGHNEDESGEQMLNLSICQRDAQSGNFRFIWAEFPGLEVADSYMNENGVCIASDGCSSREDRDDFTDGGILYNVRMNAGKYASSARDAVRMIGKDVEKYGYRGSGRTYLVADPNEGWIVSVVKGRHWVAQRVPDDKVMIIPNCFTISEVDLSDTANFAGSADLVSYAQERGWYNPDTDGEFSFRKAYANPASLVSNGNTVRHKLVVDFVTDGKYKYDPLTVEWAVTPARKLGVEDIIEALSQHTADDGSGKHPSSVCNDGTVISTICQLRNWMPLNVGCVMWTCPGRPCSEVFLPVYLGTSRLPKGWSRFQDWKEAEAKHFTDGKELRTNYPDALYWKYVDRWEQLSQDYSNRIGVRHKGIDALQSKLLKKQRSLESRLLKMSERRAERVMNRYLRRYQKAALRVR